MDVQQVYAFERVRAAMVRRMRHTRAVERLAGKTQTQVSSRVDTDDSGSQSFDSRTMTPSKPKPVAAP